MSFALAYSDQAIVDQNRESVYHNLAGFGI
jgi:hypothetical protein